MEYLFTAEYAGLEQLLGGDGVALLCKAAEDVRKHEGDLDALFREWVVRPLYTEAYYKQLLQENEFRECLNALRAELAQYIVQAYQVNPEEPLWRKSYWWWKIPEACDTPVVSFVEQWRLPERALGDIIGNLLQAVDLHLRERVPLETALSREPLTFWGVKWSQLKELETRLLLSVEFLDAVAYSLLRTDTEASSIIAGVEQTKAHLYEALCSALNVQSTSERPKPLSFAQTLLWARALALVVARFQGKENPIRNLESKWRELIQRKAREPNSPLSIRFLADFQALSDIVETLQKRAPESARNLAPEYLERVSKQMYLRLQGWSWGQISAKVKQPNRATVRKSTLYAAQIVGVPLD